MEYCITVMVQDVDIERLSKPRTIDTVWGEAVSASEEGKLFWAGDLYIRLLPPITHLLKLLPIEMQQLSWIYISIGGVRSH